MKEIRPSYYRAGRKHEPKDVIRDWDLNFNLGNTVKYVSRCGRKPNASTLHDLLKARTYLDFEIEALQEAQKESYQESKGTMHTMISSSTIKHTAHPYHFTRNKKEEKCNEN